MDAYKKYKESLSEAEVKEMQLELAEYMKNGQHCLTRSLVMVAVALLLMIIASTFSGLALTAKNSYFAGFLLPFALAPVVFIVYKGIRCGLAQVGKSKTRHLAQFSLLQLN